MGRYPHPKDIVIQVAGTNGFKNVYRMLPDQPSYVCGSQIMVLLLTFLKP